MLDVLRRNASGWIAKILIGLLVLSFAVWGVADMITGVGRSTAASVGSTEISTNAFQQAYQRQMDVLTQRFGRRFTPLEAKQLFQIDRLVIDQLIAARAIDNHAQDLNLAITDKAIVNAVQSDPAFKGPDGTFSPEALDRALQSVGYSQERFLQERRKDMLRDQITDALLQNTVTPKALLDLMRTYSGEKRVVRYFSLNPQTVTLPEPTEKDLKATYEQNKSRFMTPEMRKIEVLMLTGEDARKQIPISEKDLREAYERDKRLFAIPEKRHILQLGFPTKEAAEKARAEILKGKSFEDVAKGTGATTSDIDLGEMTQAAMLDQKIAKAAFALPEGKVSEVIEGNLSTVLLFVKSVKPGKQPGFEEVEDKVRDRIARMRTAAQIRKLNDSVDDNRLAGKSLKDIAADLKLTYHAVDGLDSAGNDADGKPTLTSPDLAKIARTAFGAEVGVDNEVIELSDNGYAWLNLLSVTPQKQKPFDAVKEEVRALWEKKTRDDALKAKADELIARIEKGEAFAEVAKSASAEVKTTPAFQRGDKLQNLTPSVVSRVFALSKDDPVSAPAPGGETRMILEVAKIKSPEAMKPEDLKKAREELLNQLRDDTLTQYVSALRKELGVSINQASIERTMGIIPDG